MKQLFYIIVFLFSSEIIAQDFNISGRLIDEGNTYVAYANILLLSEDETVVAGVSSNEEGFFELKNIDPNTYNLKISFIGYKDFFKTIELSKNENLGRIILQEDTSALEEVTITAKKPTFKKEADRLIFNVENTALTQGNILDVLRNTPTVFILDNTIKIRNSSPTVYINDKKVNLSGADIIQLLESTPANSIKKVEVITTPGAKYDASSGVVLNIIMSKNLITGYRGRVFGNYKQGVFPNYSSGISNFYKNNKISLSGNYSYSKKKINRENDDKVNYLNVDNTLDEIWKSKVLRNTRSETHNTNINFDYFINDENTFSLSSNILLTPHFKYNTQNNTIVFNDNSDLLSSFNAYTLSRDNKYNLGFDADYVSKFKNNNKLSINAHYTSYDYSRGQSVDSDYFLADNTFDFDTAFRTNSNQEINIFTSQADYYKPFNEESSLSFGIKRSIVDASSDLTRLEIINNQEILDVLNSNAFDYNEDVLASYISYNDTFGDFIFKGGLRAEQTYIEGTSLNSKNKQDYLEWFPTVSLTHETSKNLNIYTKYKRRISRPNYQSLNPFQFFLNDNVIVTGNPNLQPSYLGRWDLGAIIKENHTFEVSLVTINGNINELPLQNNETNIITYTPQNIGKTTELNFAYETYFTVFDKLSIYFVTVLYQTKENTRVENQSVELEQWSNYTDFNGSINFLKDNSLSTNLSLTYMSENLQGLQRVRGILFSELAISKTILNKQGTLSLIASDLFNKSDFKVFTSYLNQQNSRFINSDNRYVKLGFSYKFGNTTLQTNERTKERKERDRLEK